MVILFGLIICLAIVLCIGILFFVFPGPGKERSNGSGSKKSPAKSPAKSPEKSPTQSPEDERDHEAIEIVKASSNEQNVQKEQKDQKTEEEKPGLNIGEDPLTREQVEESIRDNKMYTVYRNDVSWSTLPFPSKGKATTVPLQLGSLPRYAANTPYRYYFKNMGGNPPFISIGRVNPIPRIPIPMKNPPEEVIFFVSFTEIPTRRLSNESEEEYRSKKYDWQRYHDGLLFNGTTETTFDEIYGAIEPRVLQEMRGNSGIALMYQSVMIRGDCMLLKDDKMIKPKHKIYHQTPQAFHDKLARWLQLPNGKPVMHVNFNYFKRPRVKLGMGITETELACDGFMHASRRQRYKWDDTYDYNQEWLSKGALTSFAVEQSMMDGLPEIRMVPF